MTKTKKSSFVIIMILFIVSFFISLSTNFLPHSTDFGHDAGIFAYIGWAITQGKTLYTEAWDNKGPLLYFINALGVLIDYKSGIYALELITIFCSALMLYKTANLFVSRGVSVSCAIISILSLTTTLQRGNLSEEYALPFTILAFYYIAKFLKNDYCLKKYEMIIVGACIAAVFLLRINILALLGCAVLGVIVLLIKNKNYKMLGNVFLFALTGFVIFTAPFLFYLIRHNALTACINSAYFGVLGTFSAITAAEYIRNVTDMLLALAPSGTLLIILAFLLLLPKDSKKHKDESPAAFYDLCWISYFGIIATLIANCITGAKHFHYFMSFIPTIIIPFVWSAKRVLAFFNKNKPKKHQKNDYNTAVCLFLVIIISFAGVLSFGMDILYRLPSAQPGEKITKSEKVVDYIVNNTDSDDTVEAIGGLSAATANYAAQRLAPSNYFYYANGRFSDEAKTVFANKILEDMIKNQPELILFEMNIDGEKYGKRDDFILHCNNPDQWYDFIEENYTVEKTDFDYLIYKHK